MQVNLGCGTQYLDGWVNVDGNESVKADIVCDMSNGLPFDDDSVDRVLLSHVLEHIPHHKVWEFFDELYRVCKDGAVVDVFVPHFTSIHAFGITHYSAWHINSMNVFEEKCHFNYSAERYSKFTCNVQTAKLHLLMTRGNGISKKYKLHRLIPDFLFNFNRVWQMLCERFWPFGFDEIEWRLKVTKQEINMAPPKAKNPRRTAQYYRSNPEARAKKDAYNTAFNAKPEQRKKRVELKQARRDRGIDGRGGKDLSHTKSGKLVRESVSANRGRNRGRK